MIQTAPGFTEFFLFLRQNPTWIEGSSNLLHRYANWGQPISRRRRQLPRF